MGRYNRRHTHGERNNGGKGGKGDEPETMEEIIAAAIKGGARLRYGPELRENRQELQQLRGQGREIDRAYDAYAQQIQSMQAASAERTAALLGQTQAGADQLGQIGQAVTAEGAAGAQEQAASLGFGSTAADAYTGLGSSAGLSRAEAAQAMVNRQAQLGISNLTELAGREATGQRDRIRSREDLQELKRGVREDRSRIKADKGAYMAEKFYEYLQQQEENEIAREGLQLDRRGQRLDARDDRADNALDAQLAASEIADTIHDNQLADQEFEADQHDGQGGSSDDGSGLSVNEQEEYQSKIATIKAFARVYGRLVENGVKHSVATRRAARQAGVQSETWMIDIGRQLARDGSLSRAAIQSLRGNLPPGSEIPERWR